jgi:hypothetical protein
LVGRGRGFVERRRARCSTRGGFVGRIGGGPLDAVADLVGGLVGAVDRAGASGVSGAGSFCGVGFGVVTFGGVGFAGMAANVLITGLTSTRTLRTRVPVAVTTRALSEGMAAIVAAGRCSR